MVSVVPGSEAANTNSQLGSASVMEYSQEREVTTTDDRTYNATGRTNL